MAISDYHEGEKSKDTSKLKEKKEKPLTKVIVRRLPPAMSEESFINHVSPLPDYDYMYAVKGDASLGEHAFARVYINFLNSKDVFDFKEKFDNYVFLDDKGHEYPAVVEFASFQKIPRKRKPRADPKAGSIESDPSYLEFIESLKEQPKQEEKPEFSYQFSNENKEDVSTPLLDYVKQKRIDKQRIREERREERKRRDVERKKIREDDRKRHEPRSPAKNVFRSSSSMKSSLNALKEETNEKFELKDKSDETGLQDEKETYRFGGSSSGYKDYNKYGEKKPYNKMKSKYDYMDKKNDYKPKRDDYRDKEFRNRKSFEYKRETDLKSGVVKKPKKYSERREERKNEAKKAEEKKTEEDTQIEKDRTDDENTGDEMSNLKSNEVDRTEVKAGGSKIVEKTSYSSKKSTLEDRYNKDNDPREQRRIRNKDRPSMAIYRPGMLSKRRQPDGPEVESNRNAKDSE